MKRIATLIVLMTLMLPNLAFSADYKALKIAGKATGRFTLKKAMLPLTIFTIAEDAMAACEKNDCTDEMTVGKGAEITGAVLHTQIVELKDAATGAYTLIKALAEVTGELREE